MKNLITFALVTLMSAAGLRLDAQTGVDSLNRTNSGTKYWSTLEQGVMMLTTTDSSKLNYRPYAAYTHVAEVATAYSPSGTVYTAEKIGEAMATPQKRKGIVASKMAEKMGGKKPMNYAFIVGTGFEPDPDHYDPNSQILILELEPGFFVSVFREGCINYTEGWFVEKTMAQSETKGDDGVGVKIDTTLGTTNIDIDITNTNTNTNPGTGTTMLRESSEYSYPYHYGMNQYQMPYSYGSNNYCSHGYGYGYCNVSVCGYYPYGGLTFSAYASYEAGWGWDGCTTCGGQSGGDTYYNFGDMYYSYTDNSSHSDDDVTTISTTTTHNWLWGGLLSGITEPEVTNSGGDSTHIVIAGTEHDTGNYGGDSLFAGGAGKYAGNFADIVKDATKAVEAKLGNEVKTYTDNASAGVSDANRQQIGAMVTTYVDPQPNSEGAREVTTAAYQPSGMNSNSAISSYEDQQLVVASEGKNTFTVSPYEQPTVLQASAGKNTTAIAVYEDPKPADVNVGTIKRDPLLQDSQSASVVKDNFPPSRDVADATASVDVPAWMRDRMLQTGYNPNQTNENSNSGSVTSGDITTRSRENTATTDYSGTTTTATTSTDRGGKTYYFPVQENNYAGAEINNDRPVTSRSEVNSKPVYQQPVKEVTTAVPVKRNVVIEPAEAQKGKTKKAVTVPTVKTGVKAKKGN